MGMARPLLTLCGVTALVLAPVRAGAQTTMTLNEALARARQVAPQIVGGRLAIDEARARVVGADLRFQTNPELDLGIGRRSGASGSTADIDVAATQMFEPPGRRDARRSAATAAVDRSAAQLDEVTRSVLREVSVAFYRVLYFDRRIALLTTTETLATTIYQSADRRFRAGDIAVLDVNLTRTALARVKSDREAAIADRTAAFASLRQLLQIGADVQLQGDLPTLPPVDSNALLELALQRPEIRELEAALRETDADQRFAQTFSRPDVGLGISFKQEEGDRALGGVVKLTMPWFSKGQELRALSTARASRFRVELEAAKSRIRLEVESAISVFNRRRDAVQLLLTEALPGLDENEQLAARSFDAGQIGLPDLLLIRRELLETRFQYLSALLEAALARVDVDAAVGVIR